MHGHTHSTKTECTRQLIAGKDGIKIKDKRIAQKYTMHEPAESNSE